jgi:hypothetical protein
MTMLLLYYVNTRYIEYTLTEKLNFLQILILTFLAHIYMTNFEQS